MFLEDGKNTEIKNCKALIIGCGKIAGLYDFYNPNSIYFDAKAYRLNNSIYKIGFCDLDLNRVKKMLIFINKIYMVKIILN